jgi:hypothetical protein
MAASIQRTLTPKREEPGRGNRDFRKALGLDPLAIPITA